MPVTAKLSQRFYERFGDELTNELVDWLNSVDATYRSDLRDLNETNFARFDAKLEQRTAAIEAKLEQRAAGIEAKLEQRAAGIEAKLEQRAAGIEAKLEQRAAAIEARIDGLESRFTSQLASFESRMMRWMFTMLLAAATLLFAVLRQ